MAKDFNDANWDQMLSGRLPRTEIPTTKSVTITKTILISLSVCKVGSCAYPQCHQFPGNRNVHPQADT
jgi:hypothetical protein